MDTEKVLVLVPRLRRYAALMCLNDRACGDRFVESMLKDLAGQATPPFLEKDYHLMLLRMLYRELIQNASSFSQTPATTYPTGRDHQPDSSDQQVAADVLRLLASMSVEQRGALLLVVVEGLSYDHVALAIGTTTATARELLGNARRHLADDDQDSSKTA